MSEPVFARMRDCTCPGTPHEEGDGVFLLPTIGLRGGLALEADLNRSMAEGIAATKRPPDISDEVWNVILTAAVNERLIPRWLETCIRYGATGWNVPEPWDVETLLADYNSARNVADVAADMYGPEVMTPLAERLGQPSPTGSINGSTSRKPRSTRKPSRRSSRATSAATKRSTG